MELGFDSEKYLVLQSKEILKRIETNNGKLYLEFGGKICDDLHAARVLPGFKPDIKVQLLKKLKEKAEIILTISAIDIERNKIRADFDITYDVEILRLIDNLRSQELTVSAIVITLFNEQNSAKMFGNKLERRNERVYYHRFTKGYPQDVNTIVSEQGYGANPFIETKKPLVVVAAPGPSSGKLATCLSQLYHEFKKGNKAGYAKYETFPVWNLPLKHPINIAYECATADLKDFNMIDAFHFNAYGKIAVNYNRDVEIFPVLKNILQKITQKECVYKSPTDMGVNMVAAAITNDAEVMNAAKQEIIRRYFRAKCDYKKGIIESFIPERIGVAMFELDLKESDRAVAEAAIEKQKQTLSPAFALQLNIQHEKSQNNSKNFNTGTNRKKNENENPCGGNYAHTENTLKTYCQAECDNITAGKAECDNYSYNTTAGEDKCDKKIANFATNNKKFEENAALKNNNTNNQTQKVCHGEIVTGRTKTLVGAPTACILNCLKVLGDINDDIDLIPSNILEPILILNTEVLGVKYGVLNLKDVLIALSVSASVNPVAKKALQNIEKLKGTEAHSTFILSPNDEDVLKKLGINVTCEPVFLNKNLYEY